MFDWLKGKKTVIFNIAAAAASYGGVLPPKYAAWVVPAGNVVLRFISDGPETFFKSIFGFLAQPSS